MYLKPNISIPSTIEVIKNKIKTSTPFCLSRFGDGEISVLLQNQNKLFEKKTM